LCERVQQPVGRFARSFHIGIDFGRHPFHDIVRGRAGQGSHL
jgi:hypothetical protein